MDGLVQANSVLTQKKSASMVQLVQLTAAMEVIKAKLKTLSSYTTKKKKILLLAVGGPNQHFWSKTLISTLHTFILGSQNYDIGPTAKSHIPLIIQNSPLNPMA